MAEHPIEKMINSGIDYLIRENTADSWAEAIAIIIANMKDEKGLFCMPRLHDDYAEHIRLCRVLASTLRMFIDSSILASIPPNQQKKEWVGLAEDEQMQIWENTIRYVQSEVRIKDFARAIEAKLKEKNT